MRVSATTIARRWRRVDIARRAHVVVTVHIAETCLNAILNATLNATLIAILTLNAFLNAILNDGRLARCEVSTERRFRFVTAARR